jgi:DUF1365 family protein
MDSAIYTGLVTHQRYHPIHHQFHYRVFMMYLDLDELDDLFKSQWFWSVERKNIASFRRTDHLGDPNVSLKQAVINLVHDRVGFALEGPVRLLTHLRYWGYCFNPVSFYYCYDKTGQHLDVIVAEINNTPWGEQHCYVLDIRTSSNTSNIAGPHQNYHHFVFEKKFHISPLMPMELTHDWWFNTPKNQLNVHMSNIQDQKKIFTAHLNLKIKNLNSQHLAHALIHYPFMTGKIIGAIYWQALRTWLKGAPFYSHPSSQSRST